MALAIVARELGLGWIAVTNTGFAPKALQETFGGGESRGGY